MLFTIKLGNEDFQKGINDIDPFTKSKSEAIQLGAAATKTMFLVLIDENKKLIALLTSIADGSGPRGTGSLANSMSDIQLRMDQSWKLLINASIASTYAVLRPDEESDKMRLNITEQQKRVLMQRLEAAFGPSIKSGLKAGQLPLEAAAAAFYGVLQQPWKTEGR